MSRKKTHCIVTAFGKKEELDTFSQYALEQSRKYIWRTQNMIGLYGKNLYPEFDILDRRINFDEEYVELRISLYADLNDESYLRDMSLRNVSQDFPQFLLMLNYYPENTMEKSKLSTVPFSSLFYIDGRSKAGKENCIPYFSRALEKASIEEESMRKGYDVDDLESMEWRMFQEMDQMLSLGLSMQDYKNGKSAVIKNEPIEKKGVEMDDAECARLWELFN